MPPQKPRIDLPNSERAPVKDAQLIGPADPQQRMEVTVVLRRRSKAFPAVAELGARLPAQRRHLRREEFVQQHGADPDDIAKIKQFASEHGLQVKSAEPARRSVILSGTAEAFSRAFEVDLKRYRHPDGRTYRGRTGPVRIPSDLAGIIEGVFGLDDRPQAMPHFRRKGRAKGVQPRAMGQSYDPPQVAQAYDFPGGLDGSGQCIGIIELGGGYQDSDLVQFFGNLGIAKPTVTAISVDGGSNSPVGDPGSADGEVALDIEIAGAVAPGAQIAVYFAPNTDQGFLDALTTAVHDSTLNPSVISISWGGPESTWTQQALNAFDAACQDAATMGVTVFAASGDNGATDGDPNGQLTVDFPASSPFVTGCGGTKLLASGSTITDEEVWNELAQQQGATGGGVSRVFPLPSWQQTANVPAAPNGFVGRGVPDVSGDADPTTGYNVLVDGQQEVVGGTSAVAPLWAGLFALINQSLGRAVGYLNPLLYTDNVSVAVNDITLGATDGYQAGPGWDPCTGLGSPDGTKLLVALGGQPSPLPVHEAIRSLK
ncbi:MAG TPA: S53 family peptidase [Candidatus Acidoferrales bacterium]|nr:S53 family peptidase [Candidatus Acidoferrales bacterium]